MAFAMAGAGVSDKVMAGAGAGAGVSARAGAGAGVTQNSRGLAGTGAPVVPYRWRTFYHATAEVVAAHN